MAIINLAITIPDAQLPRVQTAMRAWAATNGTPNPTNAQAIEAMRAEVVAKVKSLTLSYEQGVAAAAVAPTDPT